MRGAGWRPWRGRTPANERHDLSFSHIARSHLSQRSNIVDLQPASLSQSFCRSSTVSPLSTSSTSPFQVLAASSPENTATYGATDLARVLPLLQARARGNVECLGAHFDWVKHHARSTSATTGIRALRRYNRSFAQQHEKRSSRRRKCE